MFVFVSLQEIAQPDMWNIPLAYIPTMCRFAGGVDIPFNWSLTFCLRLCHCVLCQATLAGCISLVLHFSSFLSSLVLLSSFLSSPEHGVLGHQNQLAWILWFIDILTFWKLFSSFWVIIHLKQVGSIFTPIIFWGVHFISPLSLVSIFHFLLLLFYLNLLSCAPIAKLVTQATVLACLNSLIRQTFWLLSRHFDFLEVSSSLHWSHLPSETSQNCWSSTAAEGVDNLPGARLWFILLTWLLSFTQRNTNMCELGDCNRWKPPQG